MISTSFILFLFPPPLSVCFRIYIWYPHLTPSPDKHVCRGFSNEIPLALSQTTTTTTPNSNTGSEFPSCLGRLCTTTQDDVVAFFDFVQFDFVKLLDGKALPRSLTDPISTAKAPKGLLLSGLQETGFIEYMDPGTWHLAVYNDGRNLEQVVLHSTPIGEATN